FEKQSDASADRKGEGCQGRRPDIMFVMKHNEKIHELLYVECSRISCTRQKSQDDEVKLWREVNDGMYYALSLLKTGKEPFFSTSFPNLDRALGGGIPCSSLTELVGPSNSGKTQFCLALSILATLPISMNGLDGGVCYIDTQGTFRAERLIEIAQNKFSHIFGVENMQWELNLKNMTDSIHTMKGLRQNFCIAHSTIQRSFSTQLGPVMKDIIQELYIKELKGYKPHPQKPGAELGNVKDLRLPPAPQPPSVDGNIESELAAYETEELPGEEEAAFESLLEEQFLKDDVGEVSHASAH
ncbi:6547_t:CDS:2, partial [Acaulospora colombiana]